ncbi:MAG: hypothetical protein ACYDA6_11190 [Solirubrobacteraceae bacterium]
MTDAPLRAINRFDACNRKVVALFSVVAALAGGLAAGAAPAVAYHGEVYCYSYFYHGGCAVGQYPPYGYTIGQNEGWNRSGHGVCIDVYNARNNNNEHSPYNCAVNYNYALEEPWTYGWAAHVWNWHGEYYSLIEGWYYGES